jgi:PhnB protein
MQIYVKGSVEAVEFYQSAFDAKLGFNGKNPEGKYLHAELDLFGQILAISEGDENIVGNNMQFCLHFHNNEKDIVTKAFNVLKNGAMKIDQSPGPCIFSPHMASIIDKFGVYWCIFTD